jgi:hypothetical protein
MAKVLISNGLNTKSAFNPSIGKITSVRAGFPVGSNNLTMTRSSDSANFIAANLMVGFVKLIRELTFFFGFFRKTTQAH